MSELPITAARDDLAELANRASYTGARVVLTRRGRPIAGIVSAADVELLESLETEARDRPESPLGRCAIRVLGLRR